MFSSLAAGEDGIGGQQWRAMSRKGGECPCTYAFCRQTGYESFEGWLRG